MLELRHAKNKNQPLPSKEYLKDLQGLDADSNGTFALLDELIEMGTRNIHFTGHGEPLLHKNAVDFMGRAKHVGARCSIDTNGTLLDRSIIDELIKIGYDELKITTMAGTAKIYLKTHPGVSEKTFGALKENLLYLKERKAALKVKKPHLTLVTIVTSYNYNDLKNFAEFACFIGADKVLFRPMDDIEDPCLGKMVPTTDQVVEIMNQLDVSKLYLESQGVTHNIDIFQKVFLRQLDTMELYKIIPCYYGWLAAFTDVKGMVYPCCRCYEPLGDARENSFKEIWYGRSYQKFRKKGLQINKNKKPVQRCDCYSCVHYTANLRVYKALHPLHGLSGQFKHLSPVLQDMA
jgi:MoaA/NifB/PqqE/SkfB family radical SAM enzyme